MNADNSPDDFIDSNILVYMFDSTDLEKRELAVQIGESESRRTKAAASVFKSFRRR